MSKPRKTKVWYVQVNGHTVLTDGKKLMDPWTLQPLERSEIKATTEDDLYTMMRKALEGKA
jgi:hypothetical protein